jgi:tRNA (guanine-N7-)-methyltransferase
VGALRSAKATHFLTGSYKRLDPFFGKDAKKVELDLGCGKGGFSIELANRNPDSVILAADIKAVRLGKINNKAAIKKLQNVETLRCMAWDLIGYGLPDNCIDRLHIICPDPWPKNKHRANRLVTSQFLGSLLKVIKNRGILHLATDNEPYLEWMKTAISSIKEYENFPEGIDDVRDIQTEFEKRYVSAGIKVTHLSFKINK